MLLLSTTVSSSRGETRRHIRIRVVRKPVVVIVPLLLLVMLLRLSLRLLSLRWWWRWVVPAHFQRAAVRAERKVQVFATIRSVSTIGFRAFKLFVIMEKIGRIDVKIISHVLLHDLYRDDFDDDKTLAAEEKKGEESQQQHQKSLGGGKH